MTTSKLESAGTAIDTAKIAAALVLLALGIFGFYFFSDESVLYRVLGLLAIVAVSIGLFVTTARGRSLWGFLKDSRTEVRKMVWPTRAEAMQTTVIVMIIVLIMGIFLWLLDMLLGWAVRFVIGGA